MFLNRHPAFLALILALIGLTTALNAFEFLNGRPNGDEECRQKDKKDDFQCYVKCQVDKNLKKLDLTTEEIKDFVNCMYQADEEPCSYAFQMAICTSKAFGSSDKSVETLDAEEQPEVFLLTEQQPEEQPEL